MKKSFVLAILLLTLAEFSTLLCQDYIYKQYTTADGLPSSEVYHIFQDSKGYIWFATDNGVSKYNGYEFENFDINDGLATNSTSEIYEDYKGRVWFIGISSRLSYYWNDSIVRYKYNNLISRNISNTYIYLKKGFFVDSTDNLFLSVKGAGLLKISSNGLVLRYNDYQKDSITQVIHHVANNVKIPSTIDNPKYSFDKVCIINKSEIEVIQLSKKQNNYPHHIYIHQLSDSSFWYFAGNHCYFIENKNIKYHKEFEDNIIWANFEKDEGFLISTLEEGLSFFDFKDSTFFQKRQLLKGKSISSVLKDKKGNYWLSTINNGVYCLESFNIALWGVKEGLLKNQVECIELENNKIWVGYNDNFISCISENGIEHLEMEDAYSYGVRGLFYDKKREILNVATSGYLYFIDKTGIIPFKNNHHALTDNDMRTFTALCIIPDKSNGYWISGGFGFYHLNNGVIDFDSRFDKNFFVRVNSIIQDKNGAIWLGCKDGLRTYVNGKLIHFGDKFPLLNSRILDIIEYKNVLILATKGRGILFFDKNEVYQITKDNGLVANTITCIALSGKTLRAGSLNGINRIELNDNDLKIKVDKISFVEELSDFEINAITFCDSALLLASNKGLVKYWYEKSKTPYELPLYLKHVEINGKEYSLKKSYVLSEKENNFSIKFEALSFNPKQKIQYKFKLIGLDNNWVNTQERVARYYHLEPGNYEFVVAVKNNDGHWQKNSCKIKIKITPAIWQTIFFKIAIVLFSLNVMVLLFKVRLASKKNRASLKKDVHTFMNQAISRQIHPHFLFNTLNSINNYVLKNDKKLASSYLTKFSKLIRSILEYSQHEFITLSEELEALELYLNIESMRLKYKFEYLIKIDEDVNPSEIKLPSLILQPFAENSIWHGIQPLDKKGVVKIKVSKKESTLAVEIIDNGIGRDEALKRSNNEHYKKESLGAKIIKERLDLLEKRLKQKASIEYTDLFANKVSIGTKVKISLPLIQRSN